MNTINIDDIGVVSLSIDEESSINGGSWESAGGWAGFAGAVLGGVGVVAGVVGVLAPEPVSTYAGALSISAGGHALALYALQLFGE